MTQSGFVYNQAVSETKKQSKNGALLSSIMGFSELTIAAATSNAILKPKLTQPSESF